MKGIKPVGVTGRVAHARWQRTVVRHGTYGKNESHERWPTDGIDRGEAIHLKFGKSAAVRVREERSGGLDFGQQLHNRDEVR